jgi:hypothetical protein
MWDNGGGFEEFSTRCQISGYGDLDSHDIATCEMWDNGGGFEEFSTRCQISGYGDLDSHDIATCEMWGRRHWNYFDQCNRKGCDHIVGLLSACSRVLPLEVGSCAHEYIIS